MGERTDRLRGAVLPRPAPHGEYLQWWVGVVPPPGLQRFGSVYDLDKRIHKIYLTLIYDGPWYALLLKPHCARFTDHGCSILEGHLGFACKAVADVEPRGTEVFQLCARLQGKQNLRHAFRSGIKGG